MAIKQGEAYIQVRADLAPYAKDLDRQIKAIGDKFQKALNRDLGKKIGKDLGGGTVEGLKESTKDLDREFESRLNIPANRDRGRRAGRRFSEGFGDGLDDQNVIGKTLSRFISALEDGFSALPPQAKAVVGAAVVAAIVPAGALITSALGAAIVAGVAGIGVALSSQFAEVQLGWETFVDNLRVRTVRAAEPFAGEVLASLDIFDERLEALDPKLRSVFGNASQYVQPFAVGTADAFENILTGLERGFANADFGPLSGAITSGLGDVGDVIGDIFGDILANPDLAPTLDDLFDSIVGITRALGEFANWSLTAWQDLKVLLDVVGDTGEAIGDVVDVIDALTNAPGADWAENLSEAWEELVGDVTGGSDEIVTAIKQIPPAQRQYNLAAAASIVLTKDQTKQLQALNKGLKEQLNLINDVIGTQIDYQAAIDETISSFDEYGTSLKLADENGRRNAENVQRQINTLREQVETQVAAGELTAEQGQRFYDQQIANLRKEFLARKGNIEQFDALFGALIKLRLAPVVPDKLGPFASALSGVIAALDKIIARQRAIREQGLPSTRNTTGVGPGQQKYAEGGFITEPTSALMGENYRPELVLPLTNPRRSMELLGQSPLADRMGGGDTVVYAYFDGEPFQARIVSTARAVNRSAARTISQVPRTV